MNTTFKNINLGTPKTFLDPYIFARYHQDFNNFENIQDKQAFILTFEYDKVRTHTFQPPFLHHNNLHIYGQFLHNVLMQTPYVTEPEFEKFSHQSSRVDQILSVLGFLEDTISTIRNHFPRKGPTNHIQKIF